MSGSTHNEDDKEAITNEIEALGALYGDEYIIVSHNNDQTTTISINLSTHITNASTVGSHITLSIKLPSTYPSKSLPHTPTLTTSLLSSTQSSSIVSSIHGAVDVTHGEVCLFQYIEHIIQHLQSLKTSSKTAPIQQHPAPCTNMHIWHGDPVTDKKSVFQAHAANVHSMNDIPNLLSLLSEGRKGASATHLTWACRFTDGHTNMTTREEMDDDGEKGAGKIVLSVIRSCDVNNIAVVVSRWFGGVKLGPVRFKHIANVTRHVLDDVKKNIHEQELAT